MFLGCVVSVVANASHGQDRTAEAQTFQRMHHELWVGRAAERCLHVTSCVVCVNVRVSVSKCITRAGLAGHPNSAWMLLAVSGEGDAPHPEPLPPGRPSVCVGRARQMACWKDPHQCSFEKVYGEVYVMDF